MLNIYRQKTEKNSPYQRAVSLNDLIELFNHISKFANLKGNNHFQILILPLNDYTIN